MNVSVVIPAYNAAAFLTQTLEAVRRQTVPNVETIVVDDGSADDTAAVAQTFLSQHGMRGQVIRQQNKGIAAARNAGIRAASGRYIALLDHDDLWYPDKLSAVLQTFDSQPGADLVCHDENITRDGEIVRVSHRRAPAGELYDALLLGGNFLSPSATTFRRDAALALGGFDERPEYQTVEDYDFWLRFSRTGRMVFLNQVLGEYVLVERAASRRIVAHHVALERMLRAHLDRYVSEHRGLGTRLRARRRLARVYRSAARQLIGYREAPDDQQAFVARMLRTYPLEPRNLGVALLWLAAAWRR
jgi:glycosyltransferase involved in cell wall biosynthesis